MKAKDLKIAEFSKLLENIYRAVNIGFINEMKFIADKMDTDIYEILDVSSTKPYGFVRFNPGPELEVIVYLLIQITFIGKQNKGY